MDRSIPIYLIGETYQSDAYGVLQPTPTRRMVYADITGVTASEWFDGGRSGLNPEYRIRMFAPDYQGEQIVEYNSKRYSVYRTYQARTDVLELYVEKNKGKA